MNSSINDERMNKWIDSLSLEDLRSVVKYMVILNSDAVESAMRYVEQKQKSQTQDNVLHHHQYHYYQDADPPPPLRRRSRSHDTGDDEDENRSISSRPRPSIDSATIENNRPNIQSHTTPPKRPNPTGMVSFLSPSPHGGNYKALLILCTMKPTTKIQAKYQDKSMALCKSVGIKPYIMLKESKHRECMELWHIVGIDQDEEYPQFFLQHQQQVEYLGKYETVEQLLLSDLPADAPPTATEDEQQQIILQKLLGVTIQAPPDPSKMQALMGAASPSSSSSSSSSPISSHRNKTSMAHPPTRKKSNPSTATEVTKAPNSSLHAHLENLNQPTQAYYDAESRGDTTLISDDEQSLGDDIQLIFDPPAPSNERVTVAQKLQNQQHQQRNARPPQQFAIQEEEEESSSSNYDYHQQHQRLAPTTTTTTTNLGHVQVSASPSGTWTLKETVTLKKASTTAASPQQQAAPQNNNHAFSVQLKPASQRTPPNTFQPPPEPPRKKIVNPYYALDKYSKNNNHVHSNPHQVAIQSPASPSPAPTAAASLLSPSSQPAWMQVYQQQEADQQAPPAPHRSPSQTRSESVERNKSWEKEFMGKGACYLVYDAVRGELNIHYSEMPIIGAVGVWTSPNIHMFKQAQGLSSSELIGNCASGVVQDRKLYYQGWCQFVKAAKSMDASVTILESVGVPVDFYLYCNGETTKVLGGEFETTQVDAVACVPRNSEFSLFGVKGKKWSKGAKKVGSVALFKSLSSTDGEGIASIGNVVPIPEEPEQPHHQQTAQHFQPSPPTLQQYQQPLPPVPQYQHQVSPPRTQAQYQQPQQSQTLEQYQEQQHHQPSSQQPVQHYMQPFTPAVQQSIPPSAPLPPPAPAPVVQVVASPSHPPAAAPVAALTSDASNAHNGYATSTDAPTPKGGACYLVYEPDSSGRIVEHYSMEPIEGAIGRWVPRADTKKKIAGFKFKRNLGKNVLIGNCSAGVQGRKNYCSGWCQFVRSAFVMDAEVMLWDPLQGNKGMPVDVYLYYNDSRPTHQTQRMQEGVTYTTEKLLAVSCIPKNTPFYEGMAVDLLKWLGDGNSFGYSSKMA